MSEQVVKRYDAVHIRYGDNNIRYREGLGVEMVTARDYDDLHAEAEALRVALLGIASVNPAERGIEWAKSYASDGLKGSGSELYARWLDTFKEVEALRSQVSALQSDATSWQSGYDKGREDGAKAADGWKAQHARDSAELRKLCAERDAIAAELEAIKGQELIEVSVPDGWIITRDRESIIVRREQGTAVELNHDGPLAERVMYGFLDAMLGATISVDDSRREFESLRSQRDKMAQILRDLVPGCKWRFMRPRIDQALQEVDGGN